MKINVYSDYETMSKHAAEFVAAEVNGKPKFVLGLPTGSTPIGMYKRLSCMATNGEVDFGNTTFFNLDEYYPIKKSHDQSYDYFMNKHLFSNLNVDKSRINIPNGECADPAAECAAYDKKIVDAGGLDLMVLGVGVNGHIGFNEPDAILQCPTHLTDLTPSTIEVNSRFFASAADVPKQALTMGLGNIFQAKKILLLINGKAKAGIVQRITNGELSCDMPASLLQLHRDVTVLIDKEAE